MKLFVASTAVLSMFLVACGSPVAPKAETNEWGQSVAEGKKEADKIRNMTDAEEVAYGAQLDAALKDPARVGEIGLTIKVSKNPTLVAYLDRIGQRIARSSTRSNINYTFQLVESTDVNAFATMGGFVYVNSELMKIAENEAQLAGVIAHEVAHIAKKHARDAIAKQIETKGWQKGVGGIGGTVLATFSTVLFSLPKSRAAEFEADELGFLNTRGAGYAADEMIEFYKEVLLVLGGAGGSTILKTHPDTKQRIALLERLRKPSDATGAGNNDAEYAKYKVGL